MEPNRLHTRASLHYGQGGSRTNTRVNHLTEHGVMEARRLYESPFTDVTPSGPEGLFNGASVDELIAILETVRRSALAA